MQPARVPACSQPAHYPKKANSLNKIALQAEVLARMGERTALSKAMQSMLTKAAEKEREWEPALGAILPEARRWQ
jgi:hypothetical protein